MKKLLALAAIYLAVALVGVPTSSAKGRHDNDGRVPSPTLWPCLKYGIWATHCLK